MSMAPGLRPGATLYGDAGKISANHQKDALWNWKSLKH